ncbi:hypothetical protein [Mesorhizobium sangaii]|uniref:Uncharacterized protein n=1 Tax=Mesorhizobium sangaii TaxID=505389 RepID=A0A841P9A5_9HYPH|nr:hypothetical protein [Mesorhizobium sangaii]MBB6411894.1 hypothetical protein [Mesorhizobium sangaii]
MNYALSIVSGVRPKDQIEATLGIQMAAIHLATMNAAANMGAAKTWELRESQERTLNRLARTFVAQVEALKRYRSTGNRRQRRSRGWGGARKMIDNPMNRAPRCTARSKRTGVGCKAFLASDRRGRKASGKILHR